MDECNILDPLGGVESFILQIMDLYGSPGLKEDASQRVEITITRIGTSETGQPARTDTRVEVPGTFLTSNERMAEAGTDIYSANIPGAFVGVQDEPGNSLAHSESNSRL